MDAMELMNALGFSGGSLAVGVVSGLVPVVNTEAYLLMVTAFATSEAVVPVILLTTLGQMIAKSLLYLAGGGVVSPCLLGRRATRLDEMKERLARARTGASAVVFASAVTGLPPFYLVSMAAGSLRFSFAPFLLVRGSGRLLRFAAVVAVPRLLAGTPWAFLTSQSQPSSALPRVTGRRETALFAAAPMLLLSVGHAVAADRTVELAPRELLHVIDVGAGAPVVLLPGAMGTFETAPVSGLRCRPPCPSLLRANLAELEVHSRRSGRDARPIPSQLESPALFRQTTLRIKPSSVVRARDWSPARVSTLPPKQ